MVAPFGAVTSSLRDLTEWRSSHKISRKYVLFCHARRTRTYVYICVTFSCISYSIQRLYALWNRAPLAQPRRHAYFARAISHVCLPHMKLRVYHTSTHVPVIRHDIWPQSSYHAIFFKSTFLGSSDVDLYFILATLSRDYTVRKSNRECKHNNCVVNTNFWQVNFSVGSTFDFCPLVERTFEFYHL